MSRFFESREWMDQRMDLERNCVSREFEEGINAFVQFACNQPSYQEQNTLLCPCARCKNAKQREAKVVSKHIWSYGFKGNYYVWTSHGEHYYDVGEPSNANYFPAQEEIWDQNFHASVDGYQHIPESNAYMGEDVMPPYIPENIAETINEEAYRDSVFEAFEAANQPLYDGCEEGISQLYVASRMMRAKTDYNLAEACVDEFSQTLKKVLPKPNKAPASYYETKKLTRALGLPVYKIDVCEDNCMIFWKPQERELLCCRFCGKERYYQNNGHGKKIPKHRMFYMPITDRLKRLYQLEATASHMRWHAEHMSPEGEMHHPSDGVKYSDVFHQYSDVFILSLQAN